MTMTWQNGRRLAGISKSGLNVTYTYNGDGIRTGKTVNGVKTSFIVDGSTIVSQQGTAGHALHYLYDENGKVYGFYCSDAIYYYEFNGQGDVVSLLNHHGDLAAWYTYDAWGKLLTVTDASGNAITDANHVANLNIFRYRGYCYDTETGLYYLQSRYYDPNTGRFLNQDGIIGSVTSDSSLLENNIFIYGNNNPVNFVDSKGTTAYYIGISGSVSLGPVGGSVSEYFTWDDQGNWAVQSYVGSQIGTCTAFSGSCSVIYGVVWNATTVYDLEDNSNAIGVSEGVGVVFGVDLIYLGNNNSYVPDGIQLSCGVGAGIEFHVSGGFTQTCFHNKQKVQEILDESQPILADYTVYNKDLSRPYSTYYDIYGDEVWVGSGYANGTWYERISINYGFIQDY